MKEITLKETSDWMLNKGIFKFLSNYNVPWIENYVNPIDSTLTYRFTANAEDLDLEYYTNISGGKIISNLVEALLDDNDKLTDNALTRLALLIYNKYHETWDRAFYAFALEYNPIYNKNYDENFTDTETTSGSKSEGTTYGKVITNGGTKNIVETGTDNTEHTFTDYTETTEFGKDTSDTLTFPSTRTTTTVKSGNETNVTNYNDDDDYKKEDKLTFTNRETQRDKTGQEKSTHEADNYITNTDTWGKRTNKQRIKTFNSGLTHVSDDSTYIGGSDGSVGDTSPSGHGGNGDAEHTRVANDGTYSDTTVYGVSGTPLRDKTTESGTETHTIKETGKKSDKTTYNNIQDQVTEAGSEKHQIVDDGDEKLKITGSKADNETKNLNTLETNNLTETASGTDTTTGTESGSRSLGHKYHGEGNIGVTTTQKLLTDEIKLRKIYSNLFDNLVYRNVNEVLVNSILPRDSYN